jgi:hypothetical protein
VLPPNSGNQRQRADREQRPMMLAKDGDTGDVMKTSSDASDKATAATYCTRMRLIPK